MSNEYLVINKETFKKIWAFLWSKRVVFLILIPLLLALYVRALPGMMLVTDDWAKNTVMNMAKSQIASQVDATYPNLPDSDKLRIVELEYAKLNKTQLLEQEKQASAYFKSQISMSDGTPFLQDIDSYQHYRRAGNVVDHGNQGDNYTGNGAVNGLKTENGTVVNWDGLRNAPWGIFAYGNNFHVYGIAYTYELLHSLGFNFSLMFVQYYFHIIFAALAVIPAFFIAKKVSGNIGGFFAGILTAVSMPYLVRTVAGNADTDAYPVFFGIWIAWFCLEALESNNWRSRGIWAVLGAIMIAIFAWSWSGWWYVFLFILATIGLYAVYLTVKRSIKKGNDYGKSMLNIIGIVAILICVSGLISLAIHNPDWMSFIKGPMEFIQLKDIAVKTLFPNIAVTIAEMSPMTFGSIMDNFGGPVVFWICLLAIPLVIWKRKADDYSFIFSVLFLIWGAASVFAALRGVRFTMLFTPVWAITLGVLIGTIIDEISKLAPKMQMSENASKAILILVGIVLIFGFIQTAYSIGRSGNLMISQAWYQSLDKIKNEGSPDAIINSWWDFGHWFTALGGRRTTFDGSHQVPYGAYFIGNTLLTDSDDLAVGTLRMLDCGADSGEITLNKYLGYTLDGNPKTIAILDKILVIHDAKKASAELKDLTGLTDEQVADVIQYTHCDPPEDFFITSTDMVGKASVWGHFGHWDFDKAQIYNEIGSKPTATKIQILTTKFNKTNEEATKMAYDIDNLENTELYPGDKWIAIYPGYVNGFTSCTPQNSTLICMNGGVQITKIYENKTMVGYNASYLNNANEPVQPSRFTYMLNNTFVKTHYNNTNELEIMLVGDDINGYAAGLSVGGLSDSLFTRLFYYRTGGPHFEMWSYQRGIDGQEIIVWRVDWTGKGYYGKGTNSNTTIG